jgi:hypothetical protein
MKIGLELILMADGIIYGAKPDGMKIILLEHKACWSIAGALLELGLMEQWSMRHKP